ncbi:MAG: flagellar basal-body rod protein FlgF [Desulfatiglandaceae bacterium]
MIGMLEAVRACIKEEVRMDVISNNLANAGVVGFKRDRISFQNMLQDAEDANTTTASESDGTVTDFSFVRVETDFGDGPTRNTGNTLDLAINGKGFFKVQTPEGVRYTRKGNFTTDAQGYLMTQEGNPVLGKGGSISISGKEILVDKTGRILVDGSEAGQLDLVDVSQPDKLIKVGGALFQAGDGNEEIPLPMETVVNQGYVENSNVNVAEEMVTMIHALRAFESYQKAIQMMDGLDSTATNQIGHLR